MSKIDPGVKTSSDILVKGELLAVIESDRMNQVADRSQQTGSSFPDLPGRLSGEFADQGEARFAVHQRDERALMPSADDGVSLPVTQAVLPVDDNRALVDGNPVLELAPAILAASVAFPVGLLTVQVRVKVAAPGLVGVDEAVDPLGADAEPLFLVEPFRGLLGTQVEPDEPSHVFPVLGADSAGHGLPTASVSKPLGLCGTVALLAAVAPDLPADRRNVPAGLFRYLAQSRSCLLKSVNLVSFFLGKLRVTSHKCSFYLDVLEAPMLPQLAY